MIKSTIVLLGVLSLVCGQTANAKVTFDWATVGDPGNAPDQNYFEQGEFGSVAYTYRISKYEVANSQYTEFLNAVDPTGTNPNSIYSSEMGSDSRGGIAFNAGAGSGSKYFTKANMGNKPVNFVSFFRAMRFTNWLQNGQGTGATESGVYAIGSGSEVRTPGATYFIPSENEWYKAAYYQPAAQGGDIDNYWLYPTASNVAPTIATASAAGDISNPGPNVANYNRGGDWNGQDGNATTVGSAGPLSASFYGTFDQGGNVVEWTEDVTSSSRRVLRGGNWLSNESGQAAYDDSSDSPENYSSLTGFRVASSAESDNPDFDGNSHIDGNDFLTWQRGFGMAYDATDLANWKANFGAGSPIGAVPEPSTLALSLVSLLGFAIRQRG